MIDRHRLDQLVRFAREAHEARAAESGLRDLYEDACRRAWEAEGYQRAWHELLEWAKERREAVVDDSDYSYDHGAGLYAQDGIDEVIAKMAELEEELSTR